MRDARIVSRRFGIPNSHTLEAVRAEGAYARLREAFAMGAEASLRRA